MIDGKKPKGLSNKEIKIVSYLELEGKRFFSRKDIQQFFKSENNLHFYIYNLKHKGRIEKLHNDKYYLIPIQAYTGWSEHPFVVADEIFNGQGYYIGGKAAANYWGLIDQLPTIIDLFSTNKQGIKRILGSTFKFRRVRKLVKTVQRKIKNHVFWIASKEVSKKWI